MQDSNCHARFNNNNNNTHLMALCPGLPGWAGTRKVQPIWILLKQESVGGSGISCAICKSATHPRQIPVPAPHHSIFTGRMPFLPPNQQFQSTEGKTQQEQRQQQQQQQPFYGPSSWTTRVSQYQKKHSPTHVAWSWSNLYQLLPSTTIHSILPVQFTCLTIFFAQPLSSTKVLL